MKLNIMWDPGLDAGTEKKTVKNWRNPNKVCRFVYSVV